MIFLGDIACPDEKVDNFIEWTAQESCFSNEIVIANFEACIVTDVYKRKNLTLHNNKEIARFFPKAKKVIVSLANNHMYDYPELILETKQWLESKGIGCFGLYEGNKITPYEYIDESGEEFAFFGHCWKLYTTTNKNAVNTVRVVDCSYDTFVNVVKEYIEQHPQTKVFCFMHWNYDLEKLPMPMHRILARELVDVGVEGVIGSHSHRPQGMEIYKGKPITYCLGNFYLPSGCYFNGKLQYPECSKETYAVRLKSKDIETIWFKTDLRDDSPLERTVTEEFAYGEKSTMLSPFIGMNMEEYIDYFRQNRVKNKMVPLFIKPYGFRYSRDEVWAVVRVKIIRFLKGIIRQ